MSFLVTDITPEQEQKLTEEGFSFVAMSWGRSIWTHELHGQMSSTEALELIEAEDG